MSASLSFHLSHLHILSLTSTPQDTCLRRLTNIKNTFYSLLSDMSKTQIESSNVCNEIESCILKIETLKDCRENCYPLDYLNLETARKTHKVALSQLIDALNLEKPLLPDFEQSYPLNVALEEFYTGSDLQTRRQLKEVSLLASKIIKSSESYRLFLKFLTYTASEIFQQSSFFYIPRSTAHFFVLGLTSKQSFNRMEKIGEGTYGNVFHVKGFKKEFAFKEFKKHENHENFAEDELINESICYLVIPPHPNLLKLESITRKGLYFELAQKDLNKHLKDPLCGYETLCHIFHQIASALAHIHQCGFNYKDLKLSNLLIFPDGTVKLCDLGFLALTSTDKDHIACQHFAAPEYALSEDGPISSKADVWSFGVCLFQSLTGGQYPLFSDHVNSPEYPKIVIEFLQSNIVTQEMLIKSLDRSAKSMLLTKDPHKKLLRIVVACLNFDPKARPSMEELQQILHEHILCFKSR